MSKTVLLLFAVIILGVLSHSSHRSRLPRSSQNTRKVTHLSDGSPAERLIIIDGKIYKEIKELKLLENGEFELISRLELQKMELVNGRRNFEEPEEPEAPKIPEKLREKLDIRTHWFAPGGQPEFPKLVYSLNYGWKEVYDEEEFRELKITYTAPWGMPGLRWIEVPYTSTKPESRTKVAIPSAFVPVDDEKKDAKMVPVKKVHLRAFAAENGGEFLNIPKNTPEAENEKMEVVEEPKNEDEEKQELIFKNTTTTLKMEQAVTPETLEDEKEQKWPSEKESTSKATIFLGELLGSRTDTCPPISVRGEESEPLYWIVRAHPCNENPLELAKIFTTDDGKSFAYYGRPELVSLKKKKPL